MTEPSAATTGPSMRRGALTDRRTFRWADLTVYLGFVLVFAFFATTLSDKGFLTAQNATSIVSQVTPIALMAFGAVFVLTAGEIDLSIGSVVAMSALFTALGLRHYGLTAGIAFGLLTGVGAGLLNGLLIVGLRVPSFLITLGTMQLFSGIAQLSTQLQDVPITNDTYSNLFGSGTIGPLSDAVVWLVLGLPWLRSPTATWLSAARDGDRKQSGERAGTRYQYPARSHCRDGHLFADRGACRQCSMPGKCRALSIRSAPATC